MLTSMLSAPMSNMMVGLMATAAGVDTPTPVALDAPITSGLISQTYHGFGFERLIDGYTGNTVQLKRLSDNATQDFGFVSSTGIFDLAAVNTWRSGADVDVVKFYDQKGTAIELLAVGTVTFIRSDLVKRLGTEYLWTDAGSSPDELAGNLVRSNTLGGVTCDLGDDVGYLRATSTIADVASNNAEFHMLFSPNERKTRSADDFGGNADTEYWFTYGSGESNGFRINTGSSGYTTGIRLEIGNVTINETIADVEAIPANSVNVWSGYVHSDEFGIFANGGIIDKESHSFDLSTALQNGQILVGSRFTNDTPTVDNNEYGNFCFSGLILTHELSDFNRFNVQAKLNAISQQHLIDTSSNILSMFDEVHLMSDVDSNGLVAGKNNLFDLQFNITQGSPNWDMDYALPYTGIRGIRAIGDNNGDNYFQATTTQFNNWNEATVIAIHQCDDSASNTAVAASIGQSSYTPDTTSVRSERSLALGWGHGEVKAASSVGHDATSDALDPDDYSTAGMVVDANGDKFYVIGDDVQQHPYFKYFDDIVHSTLTYDEVLDEPEWLTLFGSAVTLGQEESENLAGSDLAPNRLNKVVKPNSLDNNTYSYKEDKILTHIFTVKNPTQYNFSDNYETRRQYMHTATTRSYVSAGVQPLGSQAGSIAAQEGRGSSIHPDSNARIQSVRDFNGTRIMYLYKAAEFTFLQAQKFQVNWYKILPEQVVVPISNTVAPVVSGTAGVGETLSVTDGTWAGSPSTFTYQWKRDDVAISGATSNTYVLVSGDAGNNISCTVTADGTVSADSNDFFFNLISGFSDGFDGGFE